MWGVSFNDEPAVSNMALEIWIHLSTGTKQQKHFHPCGISRLHVSIMSDNLACNVKKKKKKLKFFKKYKSSASEERHAGVKTAKYNLHQNIYSQGNNIIFIRCCPMKSLITPALGFLVCIWLFYSYWQSQNCKAQSTSDGAISGKLNTFPAMCRQRV